MKKYYFLSSFLITFDLFTKYFVRNSINSSYFFLNEFFGLEVTYNTGIAWGMLSGHAGYTLILSVCVSIWLVREIHNKNNESLRFPLFLILSGAFGNIIERVYGLVIGNGGKVTDFIVLGPIPNFNVADSLISVGLACLLFGELKSQK